MSVCSYTNMTFLTLAEQEQKCAARRRRSLSREETRTRATTKTEEGDPAPHEHAVAARPSTRPAGAAHAVHALFKRTARRPHIIPQSEPTTSSQPPKSNTRRERIARGLTKDPAQQRPRRPLHTIESPAKESRATKARSRRRVPTATHSVRPQKHERRVR